MSNNNLLEFYTDVLTTLKIKIGDDNGLYIPTSGTKGKLPLTLNKVHMFIPTKDVIRTALEPDENDKLQVVKELFNPVDESTNKGENKSLLRLKEYMDKLINHTFAIAGEVLLKVLMDPKIEINDMYLLEIVSVLNQYKKSGIKVMVDDTTVKIFTGLYRKRIPKANRQYLHSFLKRGGKVDGIQYNRICALSFPILEDIQRLTKDDTIEGIKFRNKDIDVIEVLHTFIFSNNKDDLLNGLQFKSKDKNAPAFDSLLKMYTFVATNINNVIDGLISLDVDAEYLKESKLNMFPFAMDDLQDILKNIQSALKEVPSNISISDTVVVHNKNMYNSTISDVMLTDGNDTNIGTKLYGNISNNNNNSNNGIFNNNQQVVNEPSARDVLLGNTQSTQSNNVFGNQQQNTLFNNQQSNQLFNNNNNNSSMFNNSPNVSVVNNGWV